MNPISASSRRWRSLLAAAAVVPLVAMLAATVAVGPAGAAGETWVDADTTGADSVYNAIAYGDGTFVAAACATGIGNEFMRSTDGVTWTQVSSDSDSCYRSITYGNGRFVALGMYDHKVTTSTDGGLTWTTVCPPGDRCAADGGEYNSIAYGPAGFVAVSFYPGNRVLTSADGIDWEVQTVTPDAASIQWQDVSYGNGRYVAVSHFGKSMYSTDGINWTVADMASNGFYDVTFGNGLFVSVKYATTTGNNVQTSTDGVTWTLVGDVPGRNWSDVTYAQDTFVAVGAAGTGDRSMTSTDGTTWTLRSTPTDNTWAAVVEGDGMFVAVAMYGTAGTFAMTSGTHVLPTTTTTTTTTEPPTTTEAPTTTAAPTTTEAPTTTAAPSTSSTVPETSTTVPGSVSPTLAELDALPARLSAPLTVTQGEVLELSSGGFNPGETVQFLMRSEPVTLGTAVAAADGTAAATVTIPSTATPGAHHLYAFGTQSRTGAQAAIEVVARSSSGSIRSGTAGSSDRPGSALAFTGAGTLGAVGLGTILLGAGLLLSYVRRRN